MTSEELTWREFELMVAHIESQLCPLGAVVKSPDKIVDKVSGSLREVDASIRYKVGSTPILITIECRNRERIQDDIWIEQLVQKQEKIGASATIVVSVNGFTKPAQKSAHHYNIELRTLQEITNSQNLEWLENIRLNVDLVFWKYKSIEISLDTNDLSVTLDPVINNKIYELGHDAYIAKNDETGQKMYLGEIGSKFVDEGLFPKIPGIEAFGEVWPEEPLYVATSEGKTKLNRVLLSVEIVAMTTTLTAVKAFDYSSIEGSIAQVAEFHYQYEGGTFKVGVTHKK